MTRTVVTTLIALLTASIAAATPASALPTSSSSGADAVRWTSGSSTSTALAPVIVGARTVFAAPAVQEATITVSPQSIESYAYWAGGVRVTGAGFTPGEPVVVTDTAPTGLRLTFETVPADAAGAIDHTYKTEVNGAPVGLHQLQAVGGRSGRSATATLTVSANSMQTLRLTTSPTSISQDQFVRSPVTMTATGLDPNERLFVNLAAPDGSGQAVAGTQALFADATGTFRFPLQSATVAVPVGTWRVSVVSDSGHYGSTTYQVTPGAARTTRGTLSFSPRKLTTSALASTPLAWTLKGLAPFDPVDVTLRTPLGATIPIGTFRANGVGTYKDALRSSGTTDLGTYRMTATSRTSGDTASGSFVLTDDMGNYPPNATISITPSRVSVTAAHTPGRGFTVNIAHAPPGFLSVFVTAPDTHFPYLIDGVSPTGSSTLFESIDADGTAHVRVVFTRPQPAGTYMVGTYFTNGRLSAPVVITP